MTSYSEIGIDNQTIKFRFFSETIVGTSFTNTAFANMTERVKLDNVLLAAVGTIIAEGTLNRVQHNLVNESVFGRLSLSRAGFTTQYSEIVSVGNSFDFNYKELNVAHTFTAVPIGSYTVELQVKLNTDRCFLLNDNNGAGTRKLNTIVIS